MFTRLGNGFKQGLCVAFLVGTDKHTLASAFFTARKKGQVSFSRHLVHLSQVSPIPCPLRTRSAHAPCDPQASQRHQQAMGDSDRLGTEKLWNIERKAQGERKTTPA